jgi:hypothetical protein
MLRILMLLAVTAGLTLAADDLAGKTLRQKLDQAAKQFRDRTLAPETLVCAIPLKEFRAGRSRHIDPLERPVPPAETLDRMARPAPIQACPVK